MLSVQTASDPNVETFVAPILPVEVEPREEDSVAVAWQAAYDNRQNHLHPVMVGSTPAEGFLDTGATTTLVQPHLVPPEQILTGQQIDIIVAGGAKVTVPMARVMLDWGEDHGFREVGVMDGLPADVLLGNDLGQMISGYVTPVTHSQTRATQRDKTVSVDVQMISSQRKARLTPDRAANAQHLDYETKDSAFVARGRGDLDESPAASNPEALGMQWDGSWISKPELFMR
ncbi:uncharacterized protein LOC121393590 isoform X2 [Xenopus laevis]|uniref:Uncharacterized protein LOC121393590 isoform X2 n=1 Tax=Xenopus laevis TaxID=8355 RepID=A0A8J1KQ56_XENLA|nr:uncharacterized protein LOC121393590 isoform X2 [Xenopus laevis]